MSKETVRPDTVPENAVWNPSENEWELGKKNENGVSIGEWKWWLAPNGHLCCHTIYSGDSGNDFTYTRYHPDGTPSRKGTFVEGKEDGVTVYTKSENPTEEYFALPFNKEFEDIWIGELTYESGSIVEEKYYDKEGNVIDLNYYIKQDVEDDEVDEDDEVEEKIEATFDSVDEASERWIREGKIFKDNINDWLDIMYIDDKQPEDPCPEETRRDMGPYVLRQIEEFNSKGEHSKLRELFPPDYDPFRDEYGQDFTKCITKVTLLPDERIVAKVGQFWEDEQICYLINGDNIVEISDLISFGHSHDKTFFAKAYIDRIDITKGWDGEVVSSIQYPKGYGEEFTKKHPEINVNPNGFNGNSMGIESINVFSDGKKVILCTHAGIFYLKEKEYDLIHPMISQFNEDEDPWYLWDKNGTEEETGFLFTLDYPNADLSPDNKYIALGSQDSMHIILVEKEGKWVQTGLVEPRSSYPHAVKFNDLITDKDGNPYHQVALSSCHYSSSQTIALPLKNLTDEFYASGYDGDDTLEYIDERNWVYSILPFPNAYFLGSNVGYMWFMGAGGDNTLGYIHLGGTIMSMDRSEDRKTIVAASYSGNIVVLKNEYDAEKEGQYTWGKNNRKDPYLITNLPYVDKKRYLFWKNKKPMIW